MKKRKKPYYYISLTVSWIVMLPIALLIIYRELIREGVKPVYILIPLALGTLGITLWWYIYDRD